MLVLLPAAPNDFLDPVSALQQAAQFSQLKEVHVFYVLQQPPRLQPPGLFQDHPAQHAKHAD